jgi:hypothetical protein
LGCIAGRCMRTGAGRWFFIRGPMSAYQAADIADLRREFRRDGRGHLSLPIPNAAHAIIDPMKPLHGYLLVTDSPGRPLQSVISRALDTRRKSGTGRRRSCARTICRGKRRPQRPPGMARSVRFALHWLGRRTARQVLELTLGVTDVRPVADNDLVAMRPYRRSA